MKSKRQEFCHSLVCAVNSMCTPSHIRNSTYHPILLFYMLFPKTHGVVKPAFALSAYPVSDNKSVIPFFTYLQRKGETFVERADV
jgi:hypothetical protein